jgi:hypothetical protein
MQERKVGSVVLSKDPAIFSNSVDAILYVSLSDSFVIKVSTFSFSFCAIFLSSGGCGAANGGRVVALVVFVAALPVVVVRLGLFLFGVVKLSQLSMNLLNLKAGGWLWLTGTNVSKAD